MSAAPSHPRLFVLEQGRDRPIDYSLGPGNHEMRDVPLKLRFDGRDVQVTAAGYGPSVFVLPGARRVQVGGWTRVDEGARVSWAGRDWVFLVGELRGGPPPPRGVSLGHHVAGHPANAVLLEVEGADRGNFWRFRTEPIDVVTGVTIQAIRSEDELRLCLSVADLPANKDRVRLDGDPLAPGTTTDLAGEQLVRIVEGGATALSALVVRS